MKQSRREEIKKEIQKIEKIISNLNLIKTTEEYCFENIPDNLQGSLRGEESERAIELLEESINNLCDTVDILNEIVM